MGVASLNGIQFFDRILLFFMPKKYQPDVPYLRKVELWRVHMFTGVQCASLVGLWVIKDIKATSILFPVMLVIMMGVRVALNWVFTKNELKILDDILPEHKRTERLDDDAEVEEDKDLPGAPGVVPEDERGDGGEGGDGLKSKYVQEIPLANGCVVKIPGDLPDINISEEVNKSGVWKSLEANSNSNSSGSIKKEDTENIAKRRKSKTRQMSIVDEDADESNEDTGITIKPLGAEPAIKANHINPAFIGDVGDMIISTMNAALILPPHEPQVKKQE